MIFGAWRIAVLASLLDAVALRTRIRVEEDALSAAENS
jgi:isoprenylcysteine carboxyl methyltransferase (ICMT) family protein YpbQ